MEVYVDVLFLENLVMDFLILAATSRFLKKKTKFVRILMGALLGAFYVLLVVILPDMELYYTVFSKLLLSIAMIAVTFSPKRLPEFVKTIVCFYVVTFIFAGAAFAFLSINQSGGLVKNGALYILWDSKYNYVLIAAIVSVFLIKSFYKLIRETTSIESILVSLYVVFDGNGLWIPALVDTGNKLKDPLSGVPVIIIEADAIKDIIPKCLLDYLHQGEEANINNIEVALRNSGWFSKFRLVPYTSLGKENGILPGFRPDYIEVGKDGERKETKEVVICLYNKKLSDNCSYSALLAPELVA